MSHSHFRSNRALSPNFVHHFSAESPVESISVRDRDEKGEKIAPRVFLSLNRDRAEAVRLLEGAGIATIDDDAHLKVKRGDTAFRPFIELGDFQSTQRALEILGVGARDISAMHAQSAHCTKISQRISR